jgi:hypothetical protein
MYNDKVTSVLPSGLNFLYYGTTREFIENQLNAFGRYQKDNFRKAEGTNGFC